MRLLQARRLSRMGDASTGYEKQEEAAERWAQVHDHEIVATADDTNVSGSRDPFTRPKLGPYLANPSGFDGIIAATLDRLGRNARHLNELRSWAEDNGKALVIVSPSLQWPADDLAGPIIWDVLGRLAEYELQAITQRNRDTQAWLRANGYLVGKAMFGYEIVPHPDGGKHKTLAPDPELADVLRGMVERATAGESFTAIVRWLDSQGIPSPQGGTWSPVSVAQILRNPILAGRRTDWRGGKGKTLLKVEPLIDAATWKKLQTAMTKKPKSAPLASEAMLSGLAYCLHCGRIMHHRKITTKLKAGGTSVNEYYRCDGTQKEPSTCRNMVRINQLDAWVDGQFIGQTYGTREIIEKQVSPGTTHEDELEQIALDISTLDQDADDYDEQHAALRAERKRLRELPAEPDRVEERHTGVTVAERWESLDSLGRREYLKDAGVKVYARKDETGELDTVLVADAPEVLWT